MPYQGSPIVRAFQVGQARADLRRQSDQRMQVAREELKLRADALELDKEMHVLQMESVRLSNEGKELLLKTNAWTHEQKIKAANLAYANGQFGTIEDKIGEMSRVMPAFPTGSENGRKPSTGHVPGYFKRNEITSKDYSEDISAGNLPSWDSPADKYPLGGLLPKID